MDGRKHTARWGPIARNVGSRVTQTHRLRRERTCFIRRTTRRCYPLSLQNFAPAKPGAKEKYHEYLEAREELMTEVTKVMADNRLDAIFMKSVEDQPPLIGVATNPPYLSAVGAIDLNTFIVYASVISVPAGFYRDNLPVAVTFFGRPYSESTLIKLAYAHEQAMPS